MKNIYESRFFKEDNYKKYFINEEGELFKLLKNNSYKKINGSINPDGYVRVDLRVRSTKQGKMFFIHNIMAMVFMDYDGEVDHIDRNKLNNNLINLRKATRRENNQNKDFSSRTKRKEYDNMVDEVVNLKKLGLSNVKISEKLGLTYQQVRSRIKKGLGRE